jgi:hypothetical protein
MFQKIRISSDRMVMLPARSIPKGFPNLKNRANRDRQTALTTLCIKYIYVYLLKFTVRLYPLESTLNTSATLIATVRCFTVKGSFPRG